MRCVERRIVHKKEISAVVDDMFHGGIMGSMMSILCAVHVDMRKAHIRLSSLCTSWSGCSVQVGKGDQDAHVRGTRLMEHGITWRILYHDANRANILKVAILTNPQAQPCLKRYLKKRTVPLRRTMGKPLELYLPDTTSTESSRPRVPLKVPWIPTTNGNRVIGPLRVLHL